MEHKIYSDFEDSLIQAGTGQPIIFLHGLGMSNKVWKPIISTLSNPYRCIAIDLPGCGQKKVSNEITKIPFDFFLEDIRKTISNLKLNRVHLVGHSLGSFIALAYSSYYPEHCYSVTAISTLPEFNEEMSKAFEERAVMIEQKGLSSVIDMIVQSGFAKKSLDEKQEMIENYRRIVLENTDSQYARLCRTISKWNNWDLLRRINIPVQLIVGVEDKITPPIFSEKICNEISNCKMFVLDECGHQIHIEKPEEVSGMIKKFLCEK